MSDFYRELLAERFGPPPTAELHRPLLENVGAGGPDTAEVVAYRRGVLLAVDQERDPGTGRYTNLSRLG